MAQIDPLTQLAIAMTSKPGLYALMIGSGISRSAGIPTGYEITLELCRRLAVATGEQPSDPAIWYANKFGRAPEYSALLEDLTHVPEERQAILRGFFEPNEAEREAGLKRPSPAHVAIAKLVKAGLVRVVITTNFDRLLEQAMTELGIQPNVLASDSAIAGSEPLVQVSHAIIKINGDYLDSHIRNTVSELELYPDSTTALLSSIFNDFGLAVCGWSGDWDQALRNELERSFGRRYPLYWFSRGDPADTAAGIIGRRGATIVSITDANSALTELVSRTEALIEDRSFDRLTSHLVALRLKRSIPEFSKNRIEINDTLMRAADLVLELYRSGEIRSDTPQPDKASLNARITLVRSHSTTLLSCAVILGAWAPPESLSLLSSVLSKLVAVPPRYERVARYKLWQLLERFPAALFWNALVAGAYANDNFAILTPLLREQSVTLRNRDVLALEWLTMFSLFANIRKSIAGHENKYFGESFLLSEILAPIMRQELFIDDPDEVLRRLEYMMLLVGQELSGGTATSQLFMMSEGSRYAAIANRFLADIKSQGDRWSPLAGGLVVGTPAEVSALVQHLEKLLFAVHQVDREED